MHDKSGNTAMNSLAHIDRVAMPTTHVASAPTRTGRMDVYSQSQMFTQSFSANITDTIPRKKTAENRAFLATNARAKLILNYLLCQNTESLLYIM